MLVAVTGRASAQAGHPVPDTAFANRIAGCYELVPGPWQSASLLNSARPVPQARVTFELRPEHVPGERPDGPLHVVKSDSIARYPHGLFSIWTRIKPEEELIRIGQPYMFANFSLRVTPDGTNLVGVIVGYPEPKGDVVSSVRAPVVARRVLCEGRR